MSVEQWNGLEKITDATAQKCCALDNRAVSIVNKEKEIKKIQSRLNVILLRNPNKKSKLSRHTLPNSLCCEKKQRQRSKR
jgi:hypothetical protein